MIISNKKFTIYIFKKLMKVGMAKMSSHKTINYVLQLWEITICNACK